MNFTYVKNMALSLLKTVKVIARRKWIPFYSLKRNHRAWYSVLLIIGQNTLNENTRLIRKTLIIYVLFILNMDPGPRDQTCISCNAADSLLLSHQKPINMLEKKMKMKVLVTQLCLILCNPMDCSPPSISVHRILQGWYWNG